DAVTEDDGSEDKPEKGAKGAAKADRDRDGEEEAEVAVFDAGSFGGGFGSGAEAGDLYEQAVSVVLRDKKASTSYIQRRLQIGYN
ncbi:DNA translocase FtsK, partial [Enterobacter hormaechei]|uniref:DNA translocase FtsK n=3 Tax=Pseudomonadota TaxID=1224 RepID=UPI0013D75AC6